MHRFIVGTGRCGSTLLSRMLACNPEALSLFEFFNGLDGSKRFSEEPISGADYSQLICGEQPFLTMVYERGYDAPEVLYPFDAPDARFGRSEGLPWILVSMLPALTDEPQALYDEVTAFASSLPMRPPPEQHRSLFDWLAERFGRKVWVERSGASIDYLGSLNQAFPDARFLHIHRAGEESALSMREHHAFRLAIMLAYQLSPGMAESGDEPGGDRIAQLLASRPPAEFFGRWWTDQVVRGFRALPGLDAAQYLDVRFERLLSEPEETLRQIAEFLDLPDPSGRWRAEAAGLIRGIPAARFPSLKAKEREALAQACRPGNQLVGR